MVSKSAINSFEGLEFWKLKGRKEALEFEIPEAGSLMLLSLPEKHHF